MQPCRQRPCGAGTNVTPAAARHVHTGGKASQSTLTSGHQGRRCCQHAAAARSQKRNSCADSKAQHKHMPAVPASRSHRRCGQIPPCRCVRVHCHPQPCLQLIEHSQDTTRILRSCNCRKNASPVAPAQLTAIRCPARPRHQHRRCGRPHRARVQSRRQLLAAFLRGRRQAGRILEGAGT